MTPNLADGLLWYVVFLYSTVCHEAAHAWTALRLGDRTAFEGGQVSLDPLPHLRRSPFGMAVVPLLSFCLGGWMIGWASAPYDSRWAQAHPRRSAWMALAGPATNLALMLLAGLALRAGMEWHFWEEPVYKSNQHLAEPLAQGLVPWVGKLLSIIFSLNLILAVFNLLPLPTLDGASLPLLVLPPALAERYLRLLWNPTLRWVGLLLAWNGFAVIFEPVRRWAMQALFA